MARILVVDDERPIRKIVSMCLSGHGHEVQTAGSGEEAVDLAATFRPELLVLDLVLPRMGGVDTFKKIKATLPQVGCIFVTAFGSVRSAVDAMRAGGDDYLIKPFDNDDLLISSDRVLNLQRLSSEVEELRRELSTRYGLDELVGTSAAMHDLRRMMTRVAANDATVLILGESGTGKELVARGIHHLSRRRAGHFVAINCAAVPAALFESEFFGHERGAFTDAKETRLGRFEQAQGGTLFLDEVGELPLDAQAKLLRALQEKEVTRLGATHSRKVDVRIIAATNRDLESAVAAGRFREDLFWRLNVLSLRLLPLRERADDLPLLIDALIGRLNAELGSSVNDVEPAARTLLLAHDWPGNVRELENTLRRALILCDGVTLRIGDLPRWGSESDVRDALGGACLTLTDAVQRAVERVERSLIRATLAQHRGNRSATADALGINRKTLFNKMKTYGIASLGETEDDAL